LLPFYTVDSEKKQQLCKRFTSLFLGFVLAVNPFISFLIFCRRFFNNYRNVRLTKCKRFINLCLSKRFRNCCFFSESTV